MEWEDDIEAIYLMYVFNVFDVVIKQSGLLVLFENKFVKLSKIGLCVLYYCCVSCSLNYLKSKFKPNSRNHITWFYGSYCTLTVLYNISKDKKTYLEKMAK